MALFDLDKELQPFDPEKARLSPNPFTALNPIAGAIKNYRIITWHGGRGSGKTYAVSDGITRYMHSAPMKVLCGRELQVSIKDSSKAELELAIHRQGRDHLFDSTNAYIRSKRTGAEAVFKGLRSNIDSLKSIAGIKLFWGEEAQSISKETMEKLLPSIRTKGNRLLFTMNPEDEDSFVYQELVAKAGQPGYEDRLAIQVNYYDNPYFTESLESDRINALQRILDAPTEDARQQAEADYAWIWLGFTKKIVGNAVMKRTEVREFEAPPAYEQEFHYGADWSNGGADPTAGVRCFIASNERGKACLWIDFELYTNNHSLDELPALFSESLPGLTYNAHGMPLPTLKADSSLPLAINKMNDNRILCEGAKKEQGSVEQGIMFLNNFDRIYIHPRCADMIMEAKKYRWKVDKKTGKILPQFEKGNDHLWDAVRYALEHLIMEKPESFFQFTQELCTWQWSEIGRQFVKVEAINNASGGFSGSMGFI